MELTHERGDFFQHQTLHLLNSGEFVPFLHHVFGVNVLSFVEIKVFARVAHVENIEVDVSPASSPDSTSMFRKDVMVVFCGAL